MTTHFQPGTKLVGNAPSPVLAINPVGQPVVILYARRELVVEHSAPVQRVDMWPAQTWAQQVSSYSFGTRRSTPTLRALTPSYTDARVYIDFARPCCWAFRGQSFSKNVAPK